MNAVKCGEVLLREYLEGRIKVIERASYCEVEVGLHLQTHALIYVCHGKTYDRAI
jgi:hypothetical protein